MDNNKIFICEKSAIGENQARGFVLEHEGEKYDIIIWRKGDKFQAFKNSCPHMGTPLESFPGRFLTRDGKHLLCSTHGARFDETGKCIAGPCLGASLQALILCEEGNKIILESTKLSPK